MRAFSLAAAVTVLAMAAAPAGAQQGGPPGYPPYGAPGARYAPPAPPPPPPPPGNWRGPPPRIAYQGFPDGTRVWSSTTYSDEGRGAIRGNMWYPPSVTTTVTVETPPVVLPPPRIEYVTRTVYLPAPRVAHRRVWHRARRCSCTCAPACR